MNDSSIPVAYAMNVSPKRYALFLGAGISIDAGLPTGKNIAARLIQDYAAAKGKKIPKKYDDDSCILWFENETGKKATFDLLMKELGISEQNRGDGLIRYIPPKDKQGNPPLPTQAHEIIAQLVKDGFISTIITTNFDPLLEDVITRTSGKPVVITLDSDPALKSVIPDKCRVIKVNGDITGKDLKITPEDLKKYPANIEKYLLRIFEEYGLIVCGWSAEYDARLLELLKSLKIYRYPSFWCLRPKSEIPNSLVNTMKPIPIEIVTADQFFTDIHAVLHRLRNIDHQQHLTVTLAVKKVTDSLQQPHPDILLADIFHTEVDQILDELSLEGYVPLGETHIPSLYTSRYSLLYEKTAPLAAMVATIAYYDDTKYCELIFDIIERLINAPIGDPFTEGSKKFTGCGGGVYIGEVGSLLNRLRLVPAMFVVYSAGIAAAKAEHFNMLEMILTPKIFNKWKVSQSGISYSQFVNYSYIFKFGGLWVDAAGNTSYDTIRSYDKVYSDIYGAVKHLIPGENRYSQMFDIFEFLNGLNLLKELKEDISLNDLNEGKLPVLDSRLVMRTKHSNPERKMMFPDFFASYFLGFGRKIQGTSFFGGVPARFEEANEKYAKLFNIEPVKTGIMPPSKPL